MLLQHLLLVLLEYHIDVVYSVFVFTGFGPCYLIAEAAARQSARILLLHLSSV